MSVHLYLHTAVANKIRHGSQITPGRIVLPRRICVSPVSPAASVQLRPRMRTMSANRVKVLSCCSGT